MTTRKITRKKPADLTRTVRRPVTVPRFTRVRKDFKLAVPPDCDASLVLKEVSHDEERRCYAIWLLVGRDDQDAMAASYKFTREDTVRVDIPSGGIISAAALEPYLAKFLRGERVGEDDTPIIKGSGR